MLNKSNQGRSSEEIKQLLQNVSDNYLTLEKYNRVLSKGKGAKEKQVKENQGVMLETLNHLRRVKELVQTYDGTDAPIYRRKLANISEKVEDILKEIRSSEEKGLIEARRSMNRMSDGNTPDAQEEEGKGPPFGKS